MLDFIYHKNKIEFNINISSIVHGFQSIKNRARCEIVLGILEFSNRARLQTSSILCLIKPSSV